MLTRAQQISLVLFPKFTGFASIIGSSLILRDIWRLRYGWNRKRRGTNKTTGSNLNNKIDKGQELEGIQDQRLMELANNGVSSSSPSSSTTSTFLSPRHRILVGLSFFDIIGSFFMGVLTSWPMPSDIDTPGRMWNSGNMGTCQFQGFFIQWAILATALYNFFLSLYYILFIKFGWSNTYISSKIEPWFHIVAVSIGLATAIIGLVMDLYNPLPYHWCWIAPVPLTCTQSYTNEDGTSDCIRGDNSTLYRQWFYNYPLMFVLAFIAIATVIIYIRLRNLRKTWVKWGTLAEHSPQLRHLKRFANQAALWVVAYYVSMGPLVSIMIYLYVTQLPKGPWWFSFIASVMLQCQGIFNAIFYFRYMKQSKSNSNDSSHLNQLPNHHDDHQDDQQLLPSSPSCEKLSKSSKGGSRAAAAAVDSSARSSSANSTAIVIHHNHPMSLSAMTDDQDDSEQETDTIMSTSSRYRHQQAGETNDAAASTAQAQAQQEQEIDNNNNIDVIIRGDEVESSSPSPLPPPATTTASNCSNYGQQEELVLQLRPPATVPNIRSSLNEQQQEEFVITFRPPAETTASNRSRSSSNNIDNREEQHQELSDAAVQQTFEAAIRLYRESAMSEIETIISESDLADDEVTTETAMTEEDALRVLGRVTEALQHTRSRLLSQQGSDDDRSNNALSEANSNNDDDDDDNEEEEEEEEGEVDTTSSTLQLPQPQTTTSATSSRTGFGGVFNYSNSQPTMILPSTTTPVGCQPRGPPSFHHRIPPSASFLATLLSSANIGSSGNRNPLRAIDIIDSALDIVASDVESIFSGVRIIGEDGTRSTFSGDGRTVSTSSSSLQEALQDALDELNNSILSASSSTTRTTNPSRQHFAAMAGTSNNAAQQATVAATRASTNSDWVVPTVLDHSTTTRIEVSMLSSTIEGVDDDSQHHRDQEEVPEEEER